MEPKSEEIESILADAVEIASETERAAFVERACAGDRALEERVVEMIADHFAAGDFLEGPAHGMVGTVTAPFAERPGAVIGPYKLLDQIGEGGFGVVFMAEQTQPVRRKVALKILKPGMDTRQVVARFEAERQALAIMDHPNIAKVFDGGTTGVRNQESGVRAQGRAAASLTSDSCLLTPDSGRPYFVMELVKGVPITDFCDQHHLTPRQRLELFIPVCQAVQHAHQKGIIHRDLKPSNVLVTPPQSPPSEGGDKGGGPVPKIIDFGVAKATGRQLTEQTLHTGFGTVVGTLEYMSPEQASFNQLDVDTRSDVYALGVLLYELLTGTTPLEPERVKEQGMLESLRMVREEETPTLNRRLSTTKELPAIAAKRGTEPAKLTRLVRGELNWIVLKALEKDRDRRYQTAGGLAQDIDNHLRDEPVLACPPSASYRLRKFARRNQRALVTATVLALCILIAVGSLGWVVRDRAGRRAEAGAQAAASLARARTWMGANQLAMARQELAEARGRIGHDRAALPRLARELEESEAQLEARVSAQQRFQDFVTWLEQAHERELPQGIAVAREGTILEDRNQRAAVPWILRALALYRVFDQDDWSNRLERDWLDTAQRTRIRGHVYEKLLWLADDVLARKEDHSTVGKLSGTAAVQQALAYLKTAEALPPATRAFYWIRSRCWRELGDADAATVDERRANEAVTVTAVDHSLRGVVAYSQKNKAEAVKEFEAALRLDPAHYWSLTWLGYCLADLGKGREPAEAVRVFTGCIALRPRHAHAYRCRAVAYSRLGQDDQAIADYSKAIELKPLDLANVLASRGNAYMRLRRHDHALADYSKAIELQPGYAAAHCNRGLVYHDLGQYEKARADFDQAIETKPDLAAAWFNRGNAHYHLRQCGKALADYTRAIELKPDYAKAWCNRGMANYDLGQHGEAVANYSRALELKPAWVEAWTCRGNVHAHLRQYDQARADYAKAVELQVDYAEAHCNLGQVLQAQGRFTEALAARRRGHELGSKQPDWRYPSAAWVRQAERLVELDKRLPAVLRGADQVADPAERMEFAGTCYRKRLFGLAARFYEEAFNAQPNLAANAYDALRFTAACAAAGQAQDEPALDDATRAHWRGKARDWLAADLAHWTKETDRGNPETLAVITRTLADWRRHPDLASVRDAAALATLPSEEQQAWRKLWADVAVVLNQAREKSRPEN